MNIDNDDEKLACDMGFIYASIMAARRNTDYVVNPEQMDKFLDMVSFFYKKAEESPGDFVDASRFEPKEENGDMSATFTVFDVWGDEVEKFCDVIRPCSVITISAVSNDKVCISCTIPGVFVHK